MQDTRLKAPARSISFHAARKRVARVLLEYAGAVATGPHRLAQRDMAVLTGTDWETVHLSLLSLCEEGAIRMERHRLIINNKLLRRLAGAA